MNIAARFMGTLRFTINLIGEGFWDVDFHIPEYI